MGTSLVVLALGGLVAYLASSQVRLYAEIKRSKERYSQLERENLTLSSERDQYRERMRLLLHVGNFSSVRREIKEQARKPAWGVRCRFNACMIPGWYETQGEAEVACGGLCPVCSEPSLEAIPIPGEMTLTQGEQILWRLLKCDEK